MAIGLPPPVRDMVLCCLVSVLSLSLAAATVVAQYPDKVSPGLDPGGTGCQSAVSSWCAILGKILPDFDYVNVSADSHRHCWLQCQAQTRCSSVNYAYQDGQCQLNVAKHSYMDELSERPGWIYTYQRQQVGR